MAFFDHFQQEQQFFGYLGHYLKLVWKIAQVYYCNVTSDHFKVSIGFGVNWSLLAQA